MSFSDLSRYQSPGALASALGARREGAAPADSSRGYLMSVLGEFVLPGGGQVWTQTLIEAMQLGGFNADAARQTIARSSQRGWLERTSVGRQTRWTLSAQAERVLELGAERIYGFGQTTRLWDRRWLVVLASVPESERKVRYRMNAGLSWAGLGSLGQGTWISPWTAHEQDAVDLLTELGVEATSFIAELGQLGDGRELATQAWDLPALRSRYEHFVAVGSAPDDDIPDGSEAVRGLVDLVHRWRQFPFHDPGLPHELLPPAWPGSDAATRFNDLRAKLAGPATRWWATTEAGYTPEAH